MFDPLLQELSETWYKFLLLVLHHGGSPCHRSVTQQLRFLPTPPFSLREERRLSRAHSCE